MLRPNLPRDCYITGLPGMIRSLIRAGISRRTNLGHLDLPRLDKVSLSRYTFSGTRRAPPDSPLRPPHFGLPRNLGSTRITFPAVCQTWDVFVTVRDDSGVGRFDNVNVDHQGHPLRTVERQTREVGHPLEHRFSPGSSFRHLHAGISGPESNEFRFFRLSAFPLLHSGVNLGPYSRSGGSF